MSNFRIYVDTDSLMVIDESELTNKFGLRDERFEESRLIENRFSSDLEAEGFCLRLIRAVTGRD